ncbi:MAG TPA: outer membrane beta-barrel protein [Pyrinomonadaceae bacterium]|nr:outer membrane beta-barrel protein [Pyrinomonadaceae bacterium]
MRKLILLALFIACSAPAAFAQDDYDKVNAFVGFSHNRVDTGITDGDPDLDDIVDEREGFNGVNGSVTGNVTRYVGLKGDYSFHTKSFNSGLAPGVEVRSNLHNFLGGVQFRDNAKEKKVKPFAHVLAGAAHATFDVRGLATPLDIDDSETGFAMAVGGGLDFRVSDRIDIRAVQFDYNPTRLASETQHNFRVGIGIVIK